MFTAQSAQNRCNASQVLYNIPLSEPCRVENNPLLGTKDVKRENLPLYTVELVFLCSVIYLIKKGKVILLQAWCGPDGGLRYSSTLPSPRHYKGVSDQQHAPAALYPWERPSTHCTGGWVGPRAGVDGRKILFRPGFDPGPSSL